MKDSRIKCHIKIIRQREKNIALSAELKVNLNLKST